MKIIYKNVSQVIKSIAWNKVTKSATDVRSITVCPVSDIQTKTRMVAVMKILSNPTEYSSCTGFFGAGPNTDFDSINKFYGSPETVDLTVGARNEFDKSFEVTESDVSSGFYAKFGISGNGTTVNTALKTVTYEVEYYFQ